MLIKRKKRFYRKKERKKEKIELLEEYDGIPFPPTELQTILFKYPQKVDKFINTLQSKRKN
jgi:hypothetical protein